MRFILLTALLIFTIAPSKAEVPTPEEHPKNEIQQKLKQKTAEHKKLQKKKQNLKNELKKKKKDIVYIASKIKKNETALIDLENRILEAEKEKILLNQKLSSDQKVFNDLVLALHRSQSLPKVALYLKQESSLKTAQTSMLLETTLQPLHSRVQKFNENLQSLSNLTETLKTNRNNAITSAKNLDENYRRLTKILADREKLYSRTNKQSAQQQKELKKIAREAQSLKELVGKIEKRQREEIQRKSQKASFTRQLKTPIPKAGQAQLPISGVITVPYGKNNAIGAKSEGIHIKPRNGSIVVAPMGGIVEYAGTFKGYGKIVILKHQKNYHSLIAGLEKVNTAVGRAVTAGEPIGKTPKKSNEAEDLYYELRYKGNPVNPSRKIAGL